MKKLKISLFMKLIILIASLLIASNYFLTKENESLFKSFTEKREESINLAFSKTDAKIIELNLSEFLNKAKNLSVLKIKNNIKKEIITKQLKTITNLEEISIFTYKENQFKEISNIISSKKIKTIKQESDLKESEQKNSLILTKINDNIFRVTTPLIKKKDSFSHFASFLINKDFFTESIKHIGMRHIIITNQKGETLFSNKEIFSDLSKKISELQQSKSNTIQKQFNSKDEDYIISKIRTPIGLNIYENLSTEVIKKPAQIIGQQGKFMMALVISVAFFFIFIFSNGLTGPIETLNNLLNEVSKGNFEVKASSYIKSNDEVGSLAKSFDKMTSGLKEREKMRNLFDKLHGESITDELLKSSMKPEGSKKNVAVFFSDIRGFTDFSERHSAEEVVEMLNSYFEIMVKIINEYGGVVDKFIGDAIVAVWGVPNETPNDCHKAVMACLEMRSQLHLYNEKRIKENKEIVKIGMGLNWGPAISGTIGSTERLEYTVIGDTVNTASRIEGATKGFGTDLLVSQNVINKIKGSFIIEGAGQVAAKGKKESFELFHINGFIDEDGVEKIIKTPYSRFEAEKSDGEKTKKIPA